MRMFSFYKVRKPRQFEHKPIYWDARKEALDDRIRRIKIEMGELEPTPEAYKPAIKGTFVEGTSHLRKSKDKGDDVQTRVYKNARLLLLLSVLGCIFWYLFFK